MKTLGNGFMVTDLIGQFLTITLTFIRKCADFLYRIFNADDSEVEQG